MLSSGNNRFSHGEKGVSLSSRTNFISLENPRCLEKASFGCLTPPMI
jgi:hypothetical protein